MTAAGTDEPPEQVLMTVGGHPEGVAAKMMTVAGHSAEGVTAKMMTVGGHSGVEKMINIPQSQQVFFI